MNDDNQPSNPAQAILDDAASKLAPSPTAYEPMLRWFEYAHLSEKLQRVSKVFHDAAHTLVLTVPACADRTVALRKLLEGKDAAVRAALV